MKTPDNTTSSRLDRLASWFRRRARTLLRWDLMHAIQDLLFSLLTQAELERGSFSAEPSTRIRAALDLAIGDGSSAAAIEATLEVAGLLVQRDAGTLASSLITVLSESMEQAQTSAQKSARQKMATFEAFCGEAKPPAAAPKGPTVSLRSIYTPRRF